MDGLDQSHAEALFAAVESGQFSATPTKRQVFGRNPREAMASDVRVYDFRRPERVSKDQMRALHTLHEGFARSLGASLSGFLRTIVELKVATCEQMTYSEFVGALPNPTSFNLVRADALDGQMCLEISPLIVYPVIDRLLGGTSQELYVPQRPMTQIELRLISNVLSRSLSSLSEAWESVRPLQFEIAAMESNPQLVQIVPPNEVVIVVALEVRMGTHAGTMNLCIPYNVIDPLMDELAAQSWFSPVRAEEAERYRSNMMRGVSRTTVEATAVLAETTITVQDLAHLQLGDIISTEQPSSGPTVLRIEGERKYFSRVGQHKRMRAVQIQRPIRPEELP